MKYTYLVLFFTVMLFGCSTNTKDLTNFDEQAWKEDNDGCNGQRLNMLDNLIAVKEQLKGLDQDHMVALLGKPDRHELYKRSQKFFYYQISPGKSCTEGAELEKNIYLSIRFNATGLSKEVIVMNYMPK